MEHESPEISWSEKTVKQEMSPVGSPPEWTRGLKQSDIDDMQQLAALSTTGLISVIRNLYDSVYQLGIVEASEMSRGRHLHIFTSAVQQQGGARKKAAASKEQ